MTPSTALWYQAKQKLTLSTELLCPVTDNDVLLEALWSGVSRGTERLVFEGDVPESEWQRMRCPHQRGDFEFPVKYGYGFVGRIMAGRDVEPGRAVFCLHPHQTHTVVPGDAVYRLPDTVPPCRAILSANMETALNVVWDAGVSAGDRVLVIGAGVVGLLIAWLIARMPGTNVEVCDVQTGKHDIVKKLGLSACSPSDVTGGCDVAINASASADGLRCALDSVGLEGRVVEASWFGNKDVALPLGEAFHSRRLQIVSSQVGQVSAGRRARWSYARRMRKAISLLADPALDHLITHKIDFHTAPEKLPSLFEDANALGIALRYQPAQSV